MSSFQSMLRPVITRPSSPTNRVRVQAPAAVIIDVARTATATTPKVANLDLGCSMPVAFIIVSNRWNPALPHEVLVDVRAYKIFHSPFWT
jgi:hypothetical protein